MVLIEGLGDEVLQVGVFIFTFFIASVCWFSANTRPELRRIFSFGNPFSFIGSYDFGGYMDRISNLVTGNSIWRRFFPVPEIVETEVTPEDFTDSSWLDFEADDSERISFYIRHLDDVTQPVITTMRETVLNFKRRHFPNEMRQNSRVKLIYNGRVLEDETTVVSSGIREDCVMHCLIFNNKPEEFANGNQSASNNGESTRSYSSNNINNSSNHNNNGNNNTNSNINNNGNNNNNNNNGFQRLMAPGEEWDLTELFCGLLIMSALTGWYCRFYYPFLFTEHSTFMLLFFTVVIFYTIYAINNES